MFITTYEKLRLYITKEKSITSLVQMAKGAFFKEATVDICAFICKNAHNNTKGIYIRLENFKGDMKIQGEKAFTAISTYDPQMCFEADAKNFAKIPGSPVAYWISKAMLNNYINFPIIGDVSNVKKGMFTCDNETFFRFWYEPQFNFIDFNVQEHNQVLEGHYVPMNSGGSFRRWYGNRISILKFDCEHYDLIAKNKGHRNPQFYFHKTAAWTKVTSGKFSIRLTENGFINNDASMAVYEKDVPLIFIVALLNTKVAQHYLNTLNESLNYTTGNVASIPYVECTNSKIESLVKDNIAISKADWDSRETSWDFERHPLV